MRIDQVGRYILKVLGKASDFVNQKDVLFILMVLLGVTIGILSLIFILWVAKDIAKWYRQRAAKRKAQKALQANKLKDEKEEELKEPWWTKLRRLFSRKKDAVAKSFENTNKILQDIIGGQDYLYTLPWFITMGDARSNKSRLLNSLSFKVPYANNVVESEQPSLHWHYYDNGVVIDFAEEFLFDEKGKAINTAEWQEFLHKLYQHHPERAIDGIVLTFDMGYFYGAFKKEKIDLSVIAKSVYKKLVELQVSVSMSLPIYVVITNAHKLTGFDAFFSNIPEHMHQNMFGWSSPYPVDEVYSSAWIKEAFESVIRSLHELRLEILTTNKERNAFENDQLFVFLNQFRLIEDDISHFITEMFRDSIKDEGYFFRGIYFSGELSGQWLPAAQQTDYETAEKKPLFIEDLFKEKIFYERSLAAPSRRYTRNINKQQLPLKVAFAVFTMLWVYNGYKSMPDIHADMRKLNVSLNDVERVINTIIDKQQHGHAISPEEFKAFSQEVLGLANAMEKTDFFYFSLPGSYVSNFDKRILDFFGMSFNKIIVHSLHNELTTRLNNIVTTKDVVLDSDFVNDPKIAFNPQDTISFKKLERYTLDVLAAERLLSSYNSIYKDQDASKLVHLLDELFGYKLPPIITDNLDILAENITVDAFEPIKEDIYRKHISEKLTELLNAFATKGVRENEGLNNLIELPDLIDDLAASGQDDNVQLEDYDKTFSKLMRTVEGIENNKLDWFRFSRFNPGDQFQNLMRSLQQSRFMEQRILKEVGHRIQQDFMELKVKIAEAESAYLNTKLYTISEDDFYHADQLAKFKDNLSDLEKQSFMVESADHEITPELGVGKLLSWNLRLLSTMNNMIETHDEFMARHLGDFEETIQPGLRKVAQKKLATNLKNFVVQAFNFQSMPISSAQVKEQTYINLIENYKKALPSLVKILGVLGKVRGSDEIDKLEEFVKNKILVALADIDRMFEDEGNLKVKDNNFSWWQGNDNPILLGFNVENQEQLVARLDSYVTRIQNYVNNLVKPLVDILKTQNYNLRPEERRLIDKWNELAVQLQDYANSKPTNTVEDLKKTLTIALKNLSYENLPKVLDTVSVSNFKTDYFTALKGHIVDQLKLRYEEIKVERVLDHYKDAAEYFNSYLANRFPFADVVVSSANVDMKEFVAFFKKVREMGTNAKEVLNAIKGRVRNFDEVELFINQAFELKDTFEPFIEDPDRNGIAFDILVDFNAKNDHNVNQKYLVDVRVKAGDKTAKRQAKPQTISWNFGDDFSVAFQVAKGATPLSPATEMPGMNIRDNTFEVAHKGEWSLFKVLSVLKAQGAWGEGSIKNFIKGNFPVEMQNSRENVTRYVKLTLTTKDQKKKRLIDFPAFPTRAPIAEVELGTTPEGVSSLDDLLKGVIDD